MISASKISVDKVTQDILDQLIDQLNRSPAWVEAMSERTSKQFEKVGASIYTVQNSMIEQINSLSGLKNSTQQLNVQADKQQSASTHTRQLKPKHSVSMLGLIYSY
jgi:ribosomal protein S3AE